MSNMRGEFLRWSGEHGGYGCEEAAFEAGWSAAQNAVETPNTSTNKASVPLVRLNYNYCPICGLRLLSDSLCRDEHPY